MSGQLDWIKGGILLGLVFVFAVWLVKPIGVSTQYVIFDGILWDLFADEIVVRDPGSASGYASSNAYLDKNGGKYAASVANPVNYGFVFALSIILGAFISARTNGPAAGGQDLTAPEVWRTRFGDKALRRNAYTFIGGFLVLFGARLADGCTSGHMMSGLMQTSVSAYLFTAGAFASGIIMAASLYGRNK